VNLALLASLHDQNKSVFFGSRLLSIQSEHLKSFQKTLIGWKKAGPPKKATFVLIM